MVSESENMFQQESREISVEQQEQQKQKPENLFERLKNYGQAIKEKVASLFSRRQEIEKAVQQVNKEASFTDEELAELDDTELHAKIYEQVSEELFGSEAGDREVFEKERADMQEGVLEAVREQELGGDRHLISGLFAGNKFNDVANRRLTANFEVTRNEQGEWAMDGNLQQEVILRSSQEKQFGLHGHENYYKYKTGDMNGVINVYKEKMLKEKGEDGIGEVEKLESYLREEAIDNLQAEISEEKNTHRKELLQEHLSRLERYHAQEQKKRLENMVNRRVQKIQRNAETKS